MNTSWLMQTTNTKNIVCYCTSGLGNRLRPLASCYAIAKYSGRKLLAYWDNITPNGCLAKWNELFENELEIVTLDKISKLKDCLLLTESGGPGHGLERESIKFGRHTLKELSKSNQVRHYDSFSYDDNQDNIIVYHNNFLPTVNKNDVNEFLFNLKPIKKIQDKIDYYVNELGLDKSIMGIHARGTDFGVDVVPYVNALRDILKTNPKQKFFLSTEDPDFEQTIINVFPENIIIRKKKNYIIRDNPNLPWDNHNSFSITTEHAQEGVEDIFLLAHTNIVIYHPLSSFAGIARIISKKF